MSALVPAARLLRPRRLLVPLYVCAGGSFLIAGAAVAAWTAVRPLQHGWWLASFLALVGGVAQLLLGIGQRALAQPASAGPARGAGARQAALWNAASLLVPLGVLTSLRLPVVVGSVALLVALGGLTRDLRRADARGTPSRGRHHAWFLSLVGFLAVSALVGTAFAWDLRWT